MHAVKMIDGNLALDTAFDDAPTFTVVQGGRGRARDHSRAVRTAAPLASFRALALVVATCVLVFSVIPSVLGRVTFEHALAGTETQQVIVDSGDSLWSLAERHPVPGMTTGDTVRLMKRWNHLEHAALVPGQELYVAVE